jgi:hypothetical protein
MLKKVVLIDVKKGKRVLLHKKMLTKLFCSINAKEKELKAMLYTYLYQTFDVTNH